MECRTGGPCSPCKVAPISSDRPEVGETSRDVYGVRALSASATDGGNVLHKPC